MTTPQQGAGPIPFAMDGVEDFPGYLLSDSGMKLHAALRGNILYVATWAPGPAGNDHFIMLADSALAAATSPAPWAKAGSVALPAASAFLAAESSNPYLGWFNTNGAATESARADGQQMEGTIDIAAAFPAMPENLYLTALAYQTADAGVLGAQTPAMVSDNGDVDPDELLVFPIEALRDEDANGVYDRLEAGRGFVVTQSGREGDTFSLSWNCFPGRSYQTQTREQLDAGAWINVEGSLQTAGATDLSLSQELALAPGEPRRFFRVMLVP